MNIAIIGAGAVGLTAGHRLAEAGHQVDVYDSRPAVGGLTGTAAVGGTQIERIYHHIFTSDKYVLDLLEELQLIASMRWHTPKSGIYLQRGLHPFSGPLDLLRFRALPFHQRISMGLLVLRARFINNWRALEHVRARDWLVRHAGKAVYDRIWGPLIRSKFDRDADDISAVWIWNKFKLRGSTRGKDVASEAFGYLDGSYGQLYESLSERIRQHGGSIRLGERVVHIQPCGDGRLSLVTDSTIKAADTTAGVSQETNSAAAGSQDRAAPDSASAKQYDRVLMTGSPEQLLMLAGVALAQQSTDAEASAITPEAESAASPGSAYAAACTQMRYKANLCAMLELDESLSPYYWITIADEDIPFVLVIEHTNLVPDTVYGAHVVYLSRYLDASDPLFTASDDEVEERFLEGLQAVFPAFSRTSVRRFHLERERDAQPVVGLHHGDKIPAMQTPVRGLYLASMAQIYPEDRGQNYAIRMGEEAAKLILDSM